MRLLFIKLRHIGDSLLLTPTLVATKRKFPQAEIWVLVRRSCEGILAGCPEINRILCTANPDTKKRGWEDVQSDLSLGALLRRTKFDHVFELTDSDRARWLALAARTPNRCTSVHRTLRWFWRPAFHTISPTKRYGKHQVMRDYSSPSEVLDLPPEAPGLRFAREKMVPFPAAEAIPSFAVVHFHTRWPRKAWPLDRWEELLRGLLEFTPAIVLSCGPASEETSAAATLVEKLGPRVISTAGSADWSQLAWLLDRALYFVGVDTAAMHLAAAVGCPTVCLFGPSPAFEFHPWNVKHWMIRPQDWLDEEAVKAIPRDALMREIPVSRVLAACREAACERTPGLPADGGAAGV